MSDILITVVITTYNGEKFIKETIESIINQSYKNLEIIIVDDGSTDSTPEIILKIKDERIKYIVTENKGHVAALNTGIANSSGEFISIMDHDDIAYPSKIEKQVNLFLSDSTIDVISQNFLVINESGKGLYEIILPSTDEEIKHELKFQNIISHSGVMYKKKIIESICGYRVEYGKIADYDLWLRLLRIANFKNIDEVLLKYRKHNQAQSNSLEAIREANAACIKVLDENIQVSVEEKEYLKSTWLIRYGSGKYRKLISLKSLFNSKISSRKKIKFILLFFCPNTIRDFYYYYNPFLRFKFILKKYSISH